MGDKHGDKEFRQGPFSKVVLKHAGRAKERLLRNLGKADRTTDEDFDVYVKNFNRQQAALGKLQKEFKNYHQCLKAMQAARRSLMETIFEVYEPCWIGVDEFLLKSEVANQNFDTFCEQIETRLLVPMASYMSQFPELSNKISKRNRKLLDYDNCRHNLQNLENVKKREEVKITKAKEQLDDAHKLFELINNELHKELPTLYDSRVQFFVSHLQCLFLTEAQFHEKDSALFEEISGILEALDEASKKVSDDEGLKDVGPQDEVNGLKLSSLHTSENTAEEDESSSTSGSTVFFTPPVTSGGCVSEAFPRDKSPIAVESFNDEVSPLKRTISEEFIPSLCDSDFDAYPSPTSDKKSESESASVPASASDSSAMACQYLYQVKGTYKYVAEDSDELSFNVGDVIDVIPFDDPDEQEDGWLKGILDGKRGLFPANFTARI